MPQCNQAFKLYWIRSPLAIKVDETGEKLPINWNSPLPALSVCPALHWTAEWSDSTVSHCNLDSLPVIVGWVHCIQVLHHFTQIIRHMGIRITFSRDGMKTLWKVYILNLQDLSSLFLICKCISSNYLEKCILSNYLEKWSCKSEREGRGWSNSLRSNSIPRARQALKKNIRQIQAGKVYILFISSARFEFRHCFDFDFLMKSIEFGLIWKHFFGKPSNKSRDKMRIIKNTKAGIFNFSFTFCQS